MSTILFIGDLHLGHRNIGRFRKCFGRPITSQENTDIIINSWQKSVNKNSTVFVMGDAAFDDEHLDMIGNLKGKKILIKGNHDDFVSTAKQVEVFSEIHGMLSYKKCWLTHCPIHPDEFRKRKLNVHGHVHDYSIMTPKTLLDKALSRPRKLDPRYLNTSIDAVLPRFGSIFVTLDQVKELIPT